MGKYLRKAKGGTCGEVAVMMAAAAAAAAAASAGSGTGGSALGVRTRARTLAMQRMQRSSSPSPAPSVQSPPAVSYLELRSRRLAKPLQPTPQKQRGREAARVSPAPDSEPATEHEASFGDNVLELEKLDRRSRETTPCSLIRASDAVNTPGSTTRRTSSTMGSCRVHNVCIPSSHELDEFFTTAEQLQQRKFIEKYNFDPVTERALPGRFDWEKIDS